MSGKKIVGILGSPRLGGNSDILLERCLNTAVENGAEIEKFVLNRMKFVPCQECANITKDGKCRIRDDMQQIYPAVEQADAIVVAAPVFFGSISAQAKMMIDRFQCQWLGIYFFKSYSNAKKKQGAFLCVEATDRKDFFDSAKAVVKNFFVTAGASYRHELLCTGVDDKGAVNERTECLEKAAEIGRKLSDA